MKIKIEKNIKSSKGLLVVPVFEDTLKNIPEKLPFAIKSFLRDRIKDKDFTGKKGEVISSYISAKNTPPKILIISFGKSNKLSGKKVRDISGKLGKYFQSNKHIEITMFLPDSIFAYSEELLQGIRMAQYRIDKLKTTDRKKEPTYHIESLTLITEKSPKDLEISFKKAELLIEGMEFAQDLVNHPSNKIDAEYLASEAQKIAKENKYKIIVLGNKELKKIGAGGILAVNQGASKEAKLIVLQYDGGDKKEKPIVLIGKGVLFDTGGYHLKPVGNIETMHQDMAGGATVLGIFKILKKLGIRKNIVGIIPAVENLISDKAYRPADIITMLSGKTVEITNTDAEGRIILADAITYGTNFNPEKMIAIATLTGAIGVALGDRYAGVFSNDSKLRNSIVKAGKEVDDLGWPMPIHEDFKKKIVSKVADIRNYDIGTGRYAGSSKGAAFLEKFFEKNKWCFIDIGGTAFTNDPKPYQTHGATAHGLRMLIKYLQAN